MYAIARLIFENRYKSQELGFKIKLVSKCLDFSLGQDEIRFENGAYTLVREYFESNFNTAIDKIRAF
jgi:hypothetical protein